jgi:murein L,D-transpeptidase YafK
MKTMWLKLIICILVVFLGAISWAHWPESSLDVKDNVTEIVILKSKRELILYSGDKPLKTYRISLGRNPIGQKEKQGDMKTPEGEYTISGRNPNSSFHLSLRISYPTPEQSLLAQQKGLDPGGDIMIHGIRNGLGWMGKFQRITDWTLGCIAVTNSEIQEIYRLVPDGIKIQIKA